MVQNTFAKLATRYSDFSGFRPIFGQTWPQNPSRTTGLVLQCRLDQKSAPQTNSKAISWQFGIRKSPPPRSPDRRKTKRSKPIGHQSWKTTLRPGTAGKASNPASSKYSLMFVYFWALSTMALYRRADLSTGKLHKTLQITVFCVGAMDVTKTY
jgi:hypothetical protein